MEKIYPARGKAAELLYDADNGMIGIMDDEQEVTVWIPLSSRHLVELAHEIIKENC